MGAAAADLDEALVMNMRNSFFTRARYDQPVAGGEHLHQVGRDLVDRGDDRYKYFGQVVGLLLTEYYRLPPTTTSDTTLAKYRSLAKEWGLIAADFARAPGPTLRLDLETGRLVEDAA